MMAEAKSTYSPSPAFAPCCPVCGEQPVSSAALLERPPLAHWSFLCPQEHIWNLAWVVVK